MIASLALDSPYVIHMPWEVTHSVIANADLQSVWTWHSNVENWVRFEGGGVESITLDGPFQCGTHITMRMGKIPDIQLWSKWSRQDGRSSKWSYAMPYCVLSVRLKG